MRVFKKIVLPTVWILIFAAIAAALVKFAFFPDISAQTGEELLEPGGQITTPVVEATTGTVINELQLLGSVQRDADISTKSTIQGTVVAVHKKEGAHVKKGDLLLTIRQDYPRKIVDFKASVAGKVNTISVIKDQQVMLGETVAEVTPETFHVVAEVQPTQLYRLLEAPESAEIQIVDGPAPFSCTSLTVINGSTGSEVTCKIPVDVKVFAGLPTKMVIQSGISENTLIIPTTAVEGGSGTGNVWIHKENGQHEIRPVTLGMSDGFNVEVREGLQKGEQILQFIPGKDYLPGADEHGCFTDNNGNTVCP